MDAPMTDEERLAAELERLTPTERAQVEFAAAMAQPVILPTAWSITPADNDGDPMVVLSVQTPASSQRVVLTRDNALAMASQLRKAAQTGPGLDLPPAAGKLVVPGR